MTEVGARDRLVMTGLVLLGLLTVIAGVLSGRSTINYVLGRDAREAALSWAGQDQQQRSASKDAHAPHLLDQNRRRAQCRCLCRPSRQAGEPPVQLGLQGRLPPGRGDRSPDHRLGPEPHEPVAERLREQARRLRRARSRPDSARRRRQAYARRARRDARPSRAARPRSRSPCATNAVVSASMPGDNNLRLALRPGHGERQARPRLRLRRRSVRRRRADQCRAHRRHADDQPPDRHGLLGSGRDRLAAHSRALARRGPDPLPRHARFADRPAQPLAASPASRPRRRPRPSGTAS